MGIGSYSAAPTVALGLGLFFTPRISIAIDATIDRLASLVSPAIGDLSFLSPAMGQRALSTKKQSEALDSYSNAVKNFKSILGQRRAQINSNQRLPNLPGQALYLARNDMISAYKDLTDALPSKIGRPNKFAIPPAYFDANNEPLLDEYRKLFDLMEAPPANAQKSDTPFKDVVDLGIAIARAKGLDADECRSSRPYQPGALLRRDKWQSKRGECALEHIQGKFPNGPIRRSNRAKEVGGDKKVGSGL